MSESILNALPLPKLAAYYEPSKNKYWTQDADEKWIPLFKDDARLILETMGYSTKPPKGKSFSEADHALAEIRAKANIVYAGPVAGQQAGVRETGGSKYLVTRGPVLLEPVKGDWGLIKKLAERLFGQDQLPYVYGWSQNAVKGLYNNIIRRGQLLVLAGPPGCGKSFWQNRVVTPMLGGRVARPMQYMTGGTTFNEDIIQAEHLMLEDENSRVDLRTRREFGTAIKNFTVNVTQRVHGKGRDAFVVESSHWMTLSVNDEAENLSVLPPLDNSLTDKIILMKCHTAINDDWPGKGEAVTELQAQIEAQVPAFIHYLLNEHKVAPELYDVRFGVKGYQDTELCERIDGLAPETELEALIDRCWAQAKVEKKKVHIGSMDMQLQLEAHNELSYRAKNLLRFTTACGVYLDRLHEKNPTKFVKPCASMRPRVWTIDFGA
jgi:hypothetical protein